MDKEKCNRDVPCRDPEIKDAFICCLYCEQRQNCSAVCKESNCDKQVNE